MLTVAAVIRKQMQANGFSRVAATMPDPKKITCCLLNELSTLASRMLERISAGLPQPALS